MPDDFVIDNLHGIIDSIGLVEIRFAGIAKSEDFVMNADGVLILDSICMRLQIIGELLKKIHKINLNFLFALFKLLALRPTHICNAIRDGKEGRYVLSSIILAKRSSFFHRSLLGCPTESGLEAQKSKSY